MIYLLLGRREQGKTTLACYLARKSDVRVYFDPRGLMSPDADTVICEHPGQRLSAAFDECWTTRRGAIILIPDRNPDEQFNTLSREVMRWVREPGAPTIAFVVDESWMADPQHSEYFMWLARCSDRQQVLIVLTSHRPVDVPIAVRSVADKWCLFQTTQQNDLDVIRDRCNEQVYHDVQRLAPREFITWDDAQATATIHRNSKAWYCKLGRPPATTIGDSLPEGETMSVDKKPLF